MKINTFFALAVAALVLLASCAPVVTPVARGNPSVAVTIGQTSSDGRDLTSHGTVSSVVVEIFDSSLAVIGNGSLKKGGTGSWYGDVAYSGTYSGPATVVVHAKDASGQALYAGYTKVASIDTTPDVKVTVAAGAFAGLVRTLALPSGTNLGELGFPAFWDGHLYVPDTTKGLVWKIKSDGSTAQKINLTDAFDNPITIGTAVSVTADANFLTVVSRYDGYVWRCWWTDFTTSGSDLKAVAHQIATVSYLNQPMGSATDGSRLFLATDAGQKIVIRANTGIWTSYDLGMVGDGVAIGGQNVYVSSWVSGLIKRVDVSGATPVINNFLGSTLMFDGDRNSAVDGTGAGAQFYRPFGMTVQGDFLYICDGSGRIRKAELSTGVVTSLAGDGTYRSGSWSDGVGADVRFDLPQGFATDGSRLFVADTHDLESPKTSRIAVIE